MIRLFTPEQVRGFDRRAFQRGASSAQLMQTAAGHLARGVLAAGGHGYGLRVAILCGKGNNGGDGLAAGRRLLATGASPVACLVDGESTLSPDAAAQLRGYRQVGGRLAESVADALATADVAVDCLLGTGASGEPREPTASAISALNGAGIAAVVACDLPSGVDADSGQVPGVAVRADLTVTLGAHKRGLWLWPARGYCGRLTVGDLGVVDDADEGVAAVLEAADVARLIPGPRPDSHKRSRGVVVVLAGSSGMTGAATLVARGAMAAGAGLVTVVTSAAARPLVAPTIPEALTIEVPEDDPDTAFERVAEQVERADALGVGPGLGHEAPTVAMVRRLVREVGVPLVVDADGLNAFRAEADQLANHKTPLLVCTPHASEFGRLVGSSDAQLWSQRATLVPRKAAAWNAVVVAKGPGSLVAAPDGRVWINPTGGAGLATGGTGDVLTGITTTLVAQRPDADSVAAGVWLHGRAGQLAGHRRAARSVTASDVAAAVRPALDELEAGT